MYELACAWEGGIGRVQFRPLPERQTFMHHYMNQVLEGYGRKNVLSEEWLKQTLAEFDAVLREAFEHDVFDHLGGFWKLVRRGQTKRCREIELGTVDPLGKGDGAVRRVAGLQLRLGDEL